MIKGRVTEEHKTNYIVTVDQKELTATVRGVFFADGNFPKVGDYVLLTEVTADKAVIEEIIPRISTIVRKEVETGLSQVIAANVDVIFIVMGLDNDFNLSRLERYLLLAQLSQVAAVVILNKSDQAKDTDDYLNQVKSASGTTPIHIISAIKEENMDIFYEYLTPDKTGVLLGSSGAGKSTITNWLLKHDAQEVAGVRQDDSRGRHTTTSRQLFNLPNGAHIIDTPGMRELGFTDSNMEAENQIFEVIEDLAQNCRFTNCDHDKSAGCAVQAAIADGTISARQLANYRKINKERKFEESQNTTTQIRQEKLRSKKMRASINAAVRRKQKGNISDLKQD